MQKPKLLLIGPLPNIPANKIGGARVSFSYLVEYLKEQGEVFELINTKTYEQGWKKIINPIYFLIQFLRKIEKSDIVFLNVSQGGTQTLGPLCFIFTRILNKKFVFRPFGGSLKDYYVKYSKPQKWIFDNTILKADIFFLQTHELIQYFTALGGEGKILHLPTSRDEPQESLIPKSKAFKKRFVFMGHIKESKGLNDILEAIEQLDDSYTIHLYGPIKEAAYEALATAADSPYKGLLKKEEVHETLSQYDVLLLPTYFSGEGYPGAIIEGYSLGLPVIASRWKAIPEIVEENKTGLLVHPKSTEALVKAIQFFNQNNYSQFSIDARSHFLENFHSKNVVGKVMQSIQELK